MNRCPVCGDSSCRSRLEADGRVIFECPRCGAFALVVALAGALPGLVQKGTVDRSALSHQIRKLQRHDDRPLDIREQDLEAYRHQLKPLLPKEQRDNLLLWIGDNQSTPGQFVHSRKKPLSAIVGCHVPAQGNADAEWDWLVNQIKPLGLFETQFSNQPSVVSLRLTLKGWDAYDELRRRRNGAAPSPEGETRASEREARAEDQR